VGAALVAEPVADRLSFGDHGSTYGGNLLACRAALCFLEQLVEGAVLDHVVQVGRHLELRLQSLQSRHPAIREIRGRGLMWGLDLDRPAAPVVDAARERGLLVNVTSQTVVRLLPPLTITEEETDEALARLDAALGAAAGGPA
jgi:acetylornithine/succinyldiaminopimelate/putrescine aminotransferase